MAAGPYPRVIVVGGSIESGGSPPVNVHVDVSTGPVEVEVVNNQPIEVAITEVADNLTISTTSNGQSTTNNFIDADGTVIAVQTYFGAPASNGSNQLIAANASKKIRVIGYTLQGVGTVTAHFRRASTAISMTWNFQAREGVVVPPGNFALFETAQNEALNLQLSDAVAVNVQVWYILVNP